MDIFVTVAAAVYGLLVGSFLNVVIHRVPAGRSVVRPASSCPVCGDEIRAVDNIPLVSWLLLRGRCRGCGTAISARYPAVELLTGVLFVTIAVRFGATAETAAFSIFVAGLVALSMIDLDCHRLPTPILIVTTGFGVAVLVVAAASRGDWWPLARAALGGAGCFVAIGAIWFVQPKGMGFGDVRLAGMIGVFLGWLGAIEPAIGLFLGFLGGAIVGIGLLLLGRAGRRTALPFGPFLAVGALLTVWFGSGLAEWYTG